MKLPRPSQKLFLPIALGSVFAAGLLVWTWVGAAEKPAANQPKAALTVSLIKPSTAQWPVTLSANGNVAAWQEASVGAEAGGLRLTDVLVNVGDHVRKGQLLARLQSETSDAELEQIKANIAEAEAMQAEARANADRARQVGSNSVLSAQQINQYLTGEQTATARVAAIKAQLKSAQIRQSQTRIVAPDDGTITVRSATLGAVVQPGMELFRMIRRDRLEWRAELPSADLARVKAGMKARVITPNKGALKARVRMVAPTVDAQSRNGLVYIDLQENGDARPGMFARGEIELGASKVIVVPQTALLLREGFSYVFRIGQDGRVIQTKVSAGQRVGDQVAILSGLESGVPVVESGVGFLVDGDLVRVAPAKNK